MPAPDPGSAKLRLEPETDQIVAVCLEDEVDMAAAPVLVRRIDEAITDNKHLIIDLNKATFIDSTVINALFHAGQAAKARGRTVVLQFGTSRIVERVIEITEIERVLPRVRTRAEAVRTIEQIAERLSP